MKLRCTTPIRFLVISLIVVDIIAAETWRGTPNPIINGPAKRVCINPQILNPSTTAVAFGWQLTVRVKNELQRYVTFNVRTNDVGESILKKKDHGLVVFRHNNASVFGLAPGAHMNSFEFCIDLSSSLNGGCFKAKDQLVMEALFFDHECHAKGCELAGSFCGDATCDPGEGCDSCAQDCIGTDICRSPVCGDGICSKGESCGDCSQDCNCNTCKAETAYLFGWDLTTTLMVGGGIVTLMFVVISVLLFRHWNAKKSMENVPSKNKLIQVIDTRKYEEEEEELQEVLGESPESKGNGDKIERSFGPDAKFHSAVHQNGGTLPYDDENESEIRREEMRIERTNKFAQRPWRDGSSDSLKGLPAPTMKGTTDNHETTVKIDSEAQQQTFDFKQHDDDHMSTISTVSIRAPRVPGYLHDLQTREQTIRIMNVNRLSMNSLPASVIDQPRSVDNVRPPVRELVGGPSISDGASSLNISNMS